MRIYFYHIERTGGTSITQMFLRNETEDYKKMYKLLVEKNGVIKVNGKRFVGWRMRSFDSRYNSNYYFAFSHIPQHRLEIPKNTFTFTILRNPIDRLVSYYKILMDIQKKGKYGRFEKDEEKFVGTFDHFLDNITKKKLLKQIYMFSPTFDIKEAEENIRSLSYWFKFENFDEGVKGLGKRLGIELKPLKTNRAETKIDIEPYRKRLEEILKDEIKLYGNLE